MAASMAAPRGGRWAVRWGATMAEKLVSHSAALMADHLADSMAYLSVANLVGKMAASTAVLKDENLADQKGAMKAAL